MTVIAGQLDMLALLETPPPAQVAPDGWTPLNFHPDDFDTANDAHNRWDGGVFKMYQGWTENQTGRCTPAGTPNPTFNYSAGLRCNHIRTQVPVCGRLLLPGVLRRVRVVDTCGQ